MRVNQSKLNHTKGRFQKKLVEFSTKGGRGVRIGQFSTKKNNCLKHSKWPKKHFKTNLFFPFLGGGGLFTITELLDFKILSSDHLVTTPLVEYSTNFFFFLFETFPKIGRKFLLGNSILLLYDHECMNLAASSFKL